MIRVKFFALFILFSICFVSTAWAYTEVTSISASPNPFNNVMAEITTITVAASPGVSGLQIHVLSADQTEGTVVRNGLTLSETTLGEYISTWNGRNNDDSLVTSGDYVLRVFNPATTTYIGPTSYVSIEGLLQPSPNTFIPTGINAASLSVQAEPGQTELSLSFVLPYYWWWWYDSSGNQRLSLTGTSTPAVYTASWNPIEGSNDFIMPDGTYTIYVYDSTGNQVATTGQITISGISSVSSAPTQFSAFGGETTAITANGAEGLNLEAKITKYNSGTGSYDLFRTLPMSASGGTYTVMWDGKNEDGNLVPLGNYTIEVWHAGSPARYYPTASVNVSSAVSSVSASPSLFSPTGANSALITVQAAPGQTGLSLSFVYWQWWYDSNWNQRLPLIETSTPGVYEASWNPVLGPNYYIMPDGTYPIYVYDSAGNQMAITGQITIAGVSSVSAVPTQFNASGGETTTITVNAAEGLNLETKITWQNPNTSWAWEVLRTLPLSASSGTYTVMWDGKDQSGNLVPLGNYIIEIWHSDSPARYYPTASVNVSVGTFSVSVSPDPFIPTGTNTAVITVEATPGQTDTKIGIPGWHDSNWNWQIPLVETSTPGIYTASWNPIYGPNYYIMPDGSYTIYVYDSAGTQMAQTGQITIAGVSSVSAAPSQFNASGGETTAITVNGAEGLNLQAKISKYNSSTGSYDLFRTLPLSASGGTYTVMWDGRDEGGNLAPLGNYTIEVWHTDSPARYYPTTSVQVSAAVSSVSASPSLFSPTGTNSALITVLAEPGLSGMKIGISGWLDSNWNSQIPLTETATPGVYTTAWNAVGYIWAYYYGWTIGIIQDGSYTIYVFDSAGNQMAATGQVTIAGVSSVTASPNPFTPGGSNFATITATGESGLNLQAEVFNNSTNALTKIISMTEASGTYTAEWDGKDTYGNFAGANTYLFRIYHAGSAVRYYPEASLIVNVAVFSISASPEPFVPSGSNNVTITVIADKGQSGLSAIISHPQGGSTPSLPLHEVGSEGTYVATWDGKINGVIPQDGICTISIYDSSWNEFPATGTLTLSSVRSFTVSPSPFEVTGSSTATVSTQMPSGLHLEARIGTLRNLSLTDGGGAYSALWDGRDNFGNFVPSGTYNITLWNVDTNTRYDLQTILVVTIVDTTPPDTTIISGPAEGSHVSSSVAFTWSGSDIMSGQLTYSFKMDGNGWSAFASITSYTFNNLAEGSHTFSVKAKDQSGNEDQTPATRNFIVYTTPPAPDVGEISGRITDAFGQGLANISVNLIGFTDDWGAGGTQTDSNGYYFISVAPGYYKVVFNAWDAVDYAPQWYNNKSDHHAVDLVLVQAGQTISNIDAKLLAATGKITGRLTDTAGHGIANAVIAICDYSDGGLLYGTHTDSNGYYTAAVPDGNYELIFNPWATEGYYVPKWSNLVAVNAGQTTANINAELEVGGAISGRVTDILGDGINLARVNVSVSVLDNELEVRTDTNGNYTLRGLPAGSYKVLFKGSNLGYVDEWYDDKAYYDYNNANIVVVTALNTTLGIDAVLAQGGSISGRVSDGTNGIQGVYVGVYDTNYNWLGNTYTDAAGNYIVRAIPTGNFKVQFDGSDSGYVGEWYNDKGDFNNADIVSVTAPNTTTEIDDVLVRGGSISGRVTDGTNGIPDIGISILDTSGNYLSYVRTDAEGNYTAGGLPTGDYKVKFWGMYSGYVNEWYNNKADMKSADTVSVTALNTTPGIDAVLVEGGSISGRVTDGINVLQNVSVSVYDANGESISWGYTDANGNYTALGIPTGSFKVRFDCNGSCSGFAGQWYNSKGDFFSADSVNVNVPDDTSNINAVLVQGLDISVSPFFMDFGSLNVDTSSANQTLYIYNSGSADLLISSVSITGANAGEFSKLSDGCSGATQTPGTMGCSVQVVFLPSSAGIKKAFLSISSNDPDTPTLNVPLSGTGFPQYTLTVNKIGTGAGTVTVNTGTIAWNNNTGVATYNDGTSITLSAIQDIGSIFTGWSGACTGTGVCIITMDSHKTVTAEFYPDVTPPNTYISGLPYNKACDSNANICWSGTDDTTPSTELQYSYQMDNSVWSFWVTDTCQIFSGLVEGLHTVNVKARDISGNEDSTPANMNFYADATPPIVSNIVADPRDYSAKITWNTSEPATSQVEYGETSTYGTSSSLISSMTGAHTVTLSGLTLQTTYHYRVKSSDGCHEVVSSDGAFTTTNILYPNLRIPKIEMRGTCRSLERSEIKWLERNDGPGSASGSWVDRVFLSADQILDAQDELLGEFTYSDGLEWETERWRVVNIDMPMKAPGTYYIIIETDANRVINETNENDNLIVKEIDYLMIRQLTAAPDQISIRITPGETSSGEIDLINLGNTSLTGITTSVEGNSSNITIQATPPASLNALTVQKVPYTVSASNESVLQNSPILKFISTEGNQATVTFNVTVNPRYPNLVSNPGYLDTTMVRGSQTMVEFEVTNTGAVAANNLNILIPATDWLSLVTPGNIVALGPGEKTKIGLSLKPAESLPLGPYTGNIALSASNGSASVNFRFTAVSDKIGGLKIIAQDEFTYFADDHPPVVNAAVKVKNPYDGSLIAEGTTDTNGQFIKDNLLEGYYNLEVSADKHGTYNATIQVIAYQVKEVKAFLPRQLVTYTWKVEPVQTEDKYVVTLEAVFETHVPAPVVTVEPTILNLSKLQYDADGKATVNYTITNHGFIAANSAALNFGAHPAYQITPLNENLGVIPAMSSMIVPVVVQKLSTESMVMKAMAGDGVKLADSSPSSLPCGVPACVKYGYVCIDDRWVWTCVSVITGECDSSYTPSTGGGGSSYGGGSIGDDWGVGPGISVPIPLGVTVEPCCSVTEDCTHRRTNPSWSPGQDKNGCGGNTFQSLALCLIPQIDPNDPDSHPCIIFAYACDLHDTCYGTCNIDPSSDFAVRRICDDEFYDRMVEACQNKYQENTNYKNDCLYWAGVFGGAVMNYGGPGFNDAQGKACCCDARK